MEGPILLLVRRSRGGMVTHLDLLLRLLGPNFRFHLAGEPAPSLVARAEALGIPVSVFPLGDDLRPADVGARRHLLALARGAGLIHAHGLKAALLALALPSRPPLLYTAHNLPAPGPRGVIGGLLERRVVAASDAVLAVSPAVARTLAAKGAPPERVFVLPPLFDPQPYQGVPPPVQEPVLGTLARLEPRKGVDVLLHAVHLLRADHPELTLLIAGDGPAEGALRRLALRLGVERHVRFLGAVAPEARADFFRRIRLYVQPSRSEGLGLAVLEALAAGRGAIVTDRGGLPDAVREGVDGAVVACRPEALAAGLTMGLREAERLGAAARRRMESDGPEAAAQAIADTYRTLLSAPAMPTTRGARR